MTKMQDNPAAGALATAYWLVTAALFAVVVVITWTWTPPEQSMGVVQKIFYLHMPVAIGTFVSCLVCFIGSVGYLYQRKGWWDDLAAAGARIGVQLCGVVLLTGMLWGKYAWGAWWTWWSPRLTFSLVLFLLYVVYLMVRISIESEQRRAVVCAVYGVVAFLDVPLVYLSTRLIPDPVHPATVPLAPEMNLTLLMWFVPVALWTAGAIRMRYRLNVSLRAHRHLLRTEAMAMVDSQGHAMPRATLPVRGSTL